MIPDAMHVVICAAQEMKWRPIIVGSKKHGRFVFSKFKQLVFETSKGISIDNLYR